MINIPNSTDNKITERTTIAPGQRKRNIEKRRAAIIEIAKRSFLEKGYEGTTMSAIAQEMGGSKGTLWSYFKSKEQLFAAVIESMASAFQSFAGMVLNPEEDIATVLTNLCKHFISRISCPEPIALQRLIVSQTDRFPEIGRIFSDHGPAVNQIMMVNFLGRQMLAGVIPVDDPEEAAAMLLDLCTAGYHNEVLYGFRLKDEEIEIKHAAKVTEHFLRCFGQQE
jgi:TetR/AcrR family transcriptional repressor of mexJK operon